ncbi:exonuclease DPD1, chloroplastic/mitochondrial-like [Cornus florida]|uniref:exonuclease DPD1, chloroplastic/mitochondrial-like n=1 Tax=Cornus florida TaxID=4283 RepID=UPI00289C29C8|nr:exonuclease DPD1, chloroplastic/mitochondrial-like [Cornus florida]
MEELIPILLQYVRSRQKTSGFVVLIAHNARTFDVPFLNNEFSRHSFEVPSDWLFLDTLPLAREAMKLGGSKVPAKTSLQALRECYEIPLVGPAHRAMSDVDALALILQRLTFDLKLPISGLVEKTFRASDSSNPKKKKLF